VTTHETHADAEQEEAAVEADASAPPPRPKIDLADSLTLAGRLGTSLVLGGLTVYIAFAGAFTAALFCGLVSVVVFVAAVRLMLKMRAENPEYIAWRAAQEEEERRQRAAAAAAGGRPS
jgi:hypothetical protein